VRFFFITTGTSMLQNIRRNAQGTAAKIVVGLIVVSFSIFGLESILLGGGSNSVAEVNGEQIDAQEVQRAITAEQRRLINRMGDNFNPALLEESRIRPRVVETIVNRKLLTQSALDLDLSISEETIGATIASMEQFQVDGAFSPVRYKQLLSDNGFTPGYFKNTLRSDLLVSQARTGLAGSDFATPGERALNARLINEQRDFRYLSIPRDKVAVDTDIDDAEIERYYQQNQPDFMSEETVDVQYIEVRLEDFREPVDEQAVSEAYELARHDFEAVTEHSVSHILIEDADSESGEARIAEALAKIEAGEDFADVAAEYSDDIGSARRGGELGVSRGNAFPEKMESVIAELQPGEVSEPFATDAGTHIVLLTDRRITEEATLEELRPQLEETLQADAARVELVSVVEELRDLSFNAENLERPARELGLEVEQINGVARNEDSGLFSNAALREAVFSEEVLVDGHNSEVIELGNNHFVVAHAKQHNLPEVQSIDTVREEIVAAILEQRTREATRQAAEEVLARLRGGTGIDVLAQEFGYEWQVELAAGRRSFSVTPEVLERVFELPAPEAGASSDYVLTAQGDAVVFELARVHPGAYDALSPEEQEQVQNQIGGEYGALVDAAYRAGLRDAAEINVL